jgi:hypothetical protein
MGLSYEDNKIIVTILMYTHEPYTENSNGIFFDVEHAKNETIDLLIRYFPSFERLKKFSP